jgi:hypothetical protein
LVLIAFWQFVNRGDDGFSTPEKYFLSVATPELTHNSDESLIGINDLDGISK